MWVYLILAKQHVICDGNNCGIKKDGNYAIYQKFRLPLTHVHMTKDEMKQIVMNEDFIDILKITWSCWYPINNKPCQKCEMCKYRVLL